VPKGGIVNGQRYQWAAPGDVNAFFGLMLDNIADLLLTVGLLSVVFQFPVDFSFQYMVPGTAIGVLVGDLIFFWMAFKLARRTGRNNVTAMPLGLDTPSTFGMVFFVLGPAFVRARQEMPVDEAALFTWHIGICAIFISGVFKFACAPFANSIRKIVPRAGLLGSLAAIALVLIAFLPLLELLHHPIVGMSALAIILATLVARIQLPFRIPGALGAVIVAGGIYHLMRVTGTLAHPVHLEFTPSDALLPTGWLTVFRFEWLQAMPAAMTYLPVVIPFALAVVVGGIDCTESAATAGDDYDTRKIVGVEALATVVASICGGVIQTTPYIGHPAYKAMGGRAAYTLSTALFVGSAGLIGYFGYLYAIIPRAAVFPILIFIGLEITAQSFHATPRRHYAAVTIACLPAMASLVLIYNNKLMGEATAIAGLTPDNLSVTLQNEILALRVLAGGFIVTSLLWASALAALIDHQLKRAGIYYCVAAACVLFGVIHSPLPGSPLFLPWELDVANRDLVLRLFVAYLAMAGIMFCLGWKRDPLIDEFKESTHGT
jgi:AGZA family xanthine/uracil permease-like MFS transporter